MDTNTLREVIHLDNQTDKEKLSDLYKLADMVWTKAWVIANQAAMLAKMADDEALKTRMVLDEIIELIDEEEKKTKKKKNGE